MENLDKRTVRGSGSLEASAPKLRGWSRSAGGGAGRRLASRAEADEFGLHAPCPHGRAFRSGVLVIAGFMEFYGALRGSRVAFVGYVPDHAGFLANVTTYG